MEVHEYGQIRGPVDPVYARTGTFLRSFPISEFKSMLLYAGATKLAMVRHGIRGELVFTRMENWGEVAW